MKKRIVMLLTVALMVAIAVAPASAQTISASGDLFTMMPMGGHHSMTTMGGDHFMMMPMG
jgi:hypothetical protein